MANCDKRCMRQWSDLPVELLSQIAERLGLIELLAFRSACKAWKSASSTASAQPQSSSPKPWFLLYGENSDQCQLLTDSDNKFTISLPYLNESTTCLASNQGWLLLFQQGGSMFFFCPFSCAKIDLPKFPVSDLSDHVAAFSSPPTSEDCTVSVISRVNDDELELNVLHRGANEWTKHKHYCTPSWVSTIKCAAYHDGEFYFFDCEDTLLNFSTKNLCWETFQVVKSGKPSTRVLPFGFLKNYFLKDDKNLKQLGLAEENVSISTCGTQMQLDSIDRLVFNESIKINADKESKSHHFKGVWIQPRFFQISPSYHSW